MQQLESLVVLLLYQGLYWDCVASLRLLSCFVQDCTPLRTRGWALGVDLCFCTCTNMRTVLTCCWPAVTCWQFVRVNNRACCRLQDFSALYSGRCTQHLIQTQWWLHTVPAGAPFVAVRSSGMLQNAACSVRFFAELAVPVSALTLWYWSRANITSQC